MKGLKEPKNFDKKIKKLNTELNIVSNHLRKVERSLELVNSGIPVLGIGKWRKKKSFAAIKQMKKDKAAIDNFIKTLNKTQEPEQEIRKGISEEEKEKYFLRQVPNRIEVSTDGKFLMFLPYNGFEMRVYNLGSEKKSPVKSIAPFGFRLQQSALRFLEDKSIEGDDVDYFLVNNIRNSRIEKTIENFMDIDSAWNNLVYPKKVRENKAKYIVWNSKSGKAIMIKQKSIGRLKPYLSESGRFLALSSTNDLVNTIKVYDLSKKGKMIKKIVGHGGEVYFSQGDQFLLSSGTDNQFKVWDLSTVQSVIDVPLFSYIVGVGVDDGIIYDKSGFYSTKNASIKTIAFGYDEKTYPLEQFDLLKNRPDTILKLVNQISGLDSSSTSYSLFSELANYRKSQILGSNSLAEKMPANLPEIDISGYLDYKGSEESISISYSLKSEVNDPITRLEVFNNNIPWRTIAIESQQGLGGSISCPLIHGENNLKFVVTSTNGYKSIAKYVLLRRMVDSTELSSRKMHLILVAVDTYPQGLEKLSKPLEDCSRMERLFKEYSVLEDTDKVIVHRIFNSDASKEALIDTIRSLSRSSINDELVVLLSGHGILMDEFNFVLPLDPSVSDRSMEYFSYSELISELQSLPMARKLLMIDACHSGLSLNNPEFDAEAVELYFKLFFNYSLPTGVQVLSSSFGLERASDGYFGVAFENVLNSFDGNIELNDFFKRLKEYNEFDKKAIQKISLTNINPLLNWNIFSKD